MLASPVWGAELLLRWTVAATADAYHLYDGDRSRQYERRVDIDASSAAIADNLILDHLTGLSTDRDYFVAVTASNAAGESDFSNEKVLSATVIGRTPPTADAGPDRIGTLGNAFALGTPPVAGVIYAWFQREGPPALLSSLTQSSITVTPTIAGTYQFTLVAADAAGVAASDTVIVTVTAGLPAPALTPTRSPTPSATPTRSATRTSTRTLTRTPTRTPTRTSMLTRTASATRTVTRKHPATLTATPTPTPPQTPAASPTPPAATVTPTVDPSPTSSASPTPSATAPIALIQPSCVGDCDGNGVVPVNETGHGREHRVGRRGRRGLWELRWRRKPNESQ